MVNLPKTPAIGTIQPTPLPKATVASVISGTQKLLGPASGIIFAIDNILASLQRIPIPGPKTIDGDQFIYNGIYIYKPLGVCLIAFNIQGKLSFTENGSKFNQLPESELKKLETFLIPSKPAPKTPGAIALPRALAENLVKLNNITRDVYNRDIYMKNSSLNPLSSNVKDYYNSPIMGGGIYLYHPKGKLAASPEFLMAIDYDTKTKSVIVMSGTRKDSVPPQTLRPILLPLPPQVAKGTIPAITGEIPAIKGEITPITGEIPAIKGEITPIKGSIDVSSPILAPMTLRPDTTYLEASAAAAKQKAVMDAEAALAEAKQKAVIDAEAALAAAKQASAPIGGRRRRAHSRHTRHRASHKRHSRRRRSHSRRTRSA